MKAFLKDIYDYQHLLNQKLMDLFIEHPEKISDKSIYLFSHSLKAHQVWNSRILDRTFVGLREVYDVIDCKTLEEAHYEDSLKILNDYDLDNMISYQNTKGEIFTNSVQEILFHASNHYTHHRGQIIADLRASGIEPIVTDYIFYKR